MAGMEQKEGKGRCDSNRRDEQRDMKMWLELWLELEQEEGLRGLHEDVAGRGGTKRKWNTWTKGRLRKGQRKEEDVDLSRTKKADKD